MKGKHAWNAKVKEYKDSGMGLLIAYKKYGLSKPIHFHCTEMHFYFNYNTLLYRYLRLMIAPLFR